MHSCRYYSFLLLAFITFIRTGNAKTISNGAYFNIGFIVEFEKEAGITQDFLEDVATSNSHNVQNITVEPRLEFDSAYFRGVSFNISGTTEAPHTEIEGTIQSLPIVKKVWPILTYHLTAPHSGSGKGAFSRRSEDSLAPFPENSSDTFSTHIQTGVDRLHKEGITGKGVTIAIMDSGIDYLHPALGGGFGKGFKVSYGYDFVGDAYNSNVTPVPDSDPYTECSAHGTHVAGIVGANPGSFGIVGVAPDATLKIYRVFGCSGDVATDVGIQASLEIEAQGADIITASIVGGGGWSEEAWATVAERINRNGTLFIFSVGNSGSEGPFTSGNPAGGTGVLAVGSVNNIDTPVYSWNGTYSVDGKPDSDFLWTPGYPAVFSSSLGLYSLHPDSDSLAAKACVPLDFKIPNPNQTVVLVTRGDCFFTEKFDNLEAAGAQYVLFYENKNDPSQALPFLDDHPFLAVGSINNKLGRKFVSLLNEGSDVHVSFASLETAKLQVSSVRNTVAGGRMNDFSSWGPTFESVVKPIASAPGGNILATVPRAMGSFAIMSGTSMAAPYIAGVAALIKQKNPTLDPVAINNLLASTAIPILYNDNTTTPYAFLAPVFQQGAGLVNAYDAVHSTLILNVSSLTFNDTAYQPRSLAFTIQNNGYKEASLEFSNIGAATLYTFKGDGDSFPVSHASGDLEKGLTTEYAELSVTPSTLIVPVGESRVVSVSVNPPKLDPKRLPLYSGFLAINSTDGRQSLTLPYAGIAGVMKDVLTLDPLKNEEALSSYNFTAGVLSPVPANTTFTMKLAANGTLDGDANIIYPAVDFILSFGTKTQIVDIVDATTGKNVTRIADGSTFNGLAAKASSGWLWDGTDVDGNLLPAGSYKWQLQALRVTGDQTKPEDFDTILSAAFNLSYSSNSTAVIHRRRGVRSQLT